MATAPAGGIDRLVGWLRESAAAGRGHRLLPGPVVGAGLAPGALEADLLAPPADAGA